MRASAVPALIGVLLLTQAAPPVQATDDFTQAGVPGPSAAGVVVNPHHLPPAAAPGELPQLREVPRLYPVDQATFERLKAQADAEAAADETPGVDGP